VAVKPPLCQGFEVVCPDGLVRGYPFHSLGDAESEAKHASRPLPITRSKFCQHVAVLRQVPCSCVRTAGNDRPGCSPWPEPSDMELRHPPCPGGEHSVRPIVFDHGGEMRGSA
jgi:hypothetical protein